MGPDKYQVYCVIGHPVAHSRSPAIHRYMGERLGIPLTFDKQDIPPRLLQHFVEESRAILDGFSVTLPHKETIIQFLDCLDSSADTAGAVNTVWNRQGILTGYNTDVEGAREALRRSGVTAPRRAVIIGAGGAARAGLAALAGMDCRAVTVLNRTAERGDRLKNDFKGMIPELSARRLEPETLTQVLTDADLLINATSVGMTPRTEQSPLADPALLSARTAVLDMVPNPFKTRLLHEADAQGCRTVSGLDMLIAQAVAAQKIWQHRSLPGELHNDIKKYLIDHT